MEENFHDRITGWYETPDESRNDASAAAPENAVLSDIVTVCAWCRPRVNILKLQRRETDFVLIAQQGQDLKIWRNGMLLRISDGICPECRRTKLT